MPQKYVTLKEVAKRAHTSTATVSYVINGGKGRYVSDELRGRVMEAARELNYVKSALASGLKGKQRGVIAVTVPQFDNIFFTRLVLAVEQVAAQQGYLVTVSNTFDEPDRENKVIESLIQQRVDGIILIPNEKSGCNYENLRRLGIPMVIAERPLLDGEYDYVLMDNFEAAYLATSHLVKRGHRQIAFLTWDARAASLKDRLRGYQAALQEQGIPYRPEIVFQEPFTAESGRSMTERLIQSESSITAIVYAYHVQAQGGLPVLRGAGFKIPEDVSVVVIGDPEWMTLYTPPLTHVTLPSDKVGETAARILLDRITNSGNYSFTSRILHSGSLMEGNSVKDLNNSLKEEDKGVKKVSVGVVGSGFAAAIHGDAYQKVFGLEVKLAAVASVEDTVEAFAKRYGIPKIYREYEELLKDPEIDVVDIITPPYLHASMICQALEAGKHVICEKPLTGYFGKPGQEENQVGNTSRREMYEEVVRQMDQLRAVVERSPKLFMYAENFVYAPSVQKTLEFLKAKKSKILYMKGEESHSGSHARHAAYWKYNGGGSLIRQGCHPLSAILYLKYQEAAIRGEEISLKSVTGDMGVVQSCLSDPEKKYILSRPVDVEDQANVVLTFSDGTKANIVAGDMVLGGVRNLVEVFTNEGTYQTNIAPNNQMPVYHVDEEHLEDVYITEKVENKCGWQNPFIDEEAARGYVGELQDFMECVATGRRPQSDFKLAYDSIRAIYGAYWSDGEGVRVEL